MTKYNCNFTVVSQTTGNEKEVVEIRETIPSQSWVIIEDDAGNKFDKFFNYADEIS